MASTDNIALEVLNDEIYKIWSSYPDHRNELAPSFIDRIIPDGLLFIGLNPAFNVRWIGKRLKENNHTVSDPIEFFRWNQKEERSVFINRILHSDKIHPSVIYPYYKKFNAIADELNTEWSDIDLFYYRDTNQNKLKEAVLDRDKLNEFGKSQFRISGQMIKLSKPKVIIFANALSSQLYRKYFKDAGFDSLHFDDVRGFHRIGYEGKEVPVFFSGMLTGQRALDLGSYERLKWHIKQALKSL